MQRVSADDAPALTGFPLSVQARREMSYCVNVEIQVPTASDWLKTSRLKLSGRSAGENYVEPRYNQAWLHVAGGEYCESRFLTMRCLGGVIV
jgi:hypothetical protein